MTERAPIETTNLDRYSSPALPWSRPLDLLAASPTPDIPFFLSTVRPDGRPHATGIGALWLDLGEEAARAFIVAKWGAMIEGQVAAPKHPKAALQEWALARKRKPPEYRLVRREGPDHAPRFLVAVAVGKLAEAEGEGASKQAAEKAAAAALLERLTQEEMK